jgi:hypothetical protein
MSNHGLAEYNQKVEQALLRHYSLNTFLCDNGTKFTLFRDKIAVTYAHGRILQIGDTLTIRRIASTNRDAFTVRVIQIHEKFDFIILEADYVMSISPSNPSLHLPHVGCNFVVCHDKEEISFEKVNLTDYADHNHILWKGYSNQMPSTSPEGGGCYQENTIQLCGICVGCKEIRTESEGRVSISCEYSFCVAGMFC